MKRFLGLTLLSLLFAVPTLRAEEPSSSPLFIENVGQFAGEGRFFVSGPAGAVWLADNAVWFTFVDVDTKNDSSPSTHVSLRFLDANLSAPTGFDASDTRVSYARGSDPAGWHSDVPVWHGVRYANLYPGLDLELTGQDGQLVHRFVGDTSSVRLEVDGAEEIALVGDQLQVDTAVGKVLLPPFVGGVTMEISTPAGQSLTYTTPETVNPAPTNPVLGTLAYSTFIGGSIEDQGNDIVHDGAGKAYAIGEYLSIDDFPTKAGPSTLLHDIDGYVAKVDVDGQSLDYLFNIMAEFEEAPNGIAIDGTGRAYVAGRTSSLDFPTTPDSWDPTPNGAGDGWILKLDPTGTTMEFSTAFGSPGREWFYDVAIDGSGNIYATGPTNSPNTPTSPGAFDRTFNGDWDVFLVKLNNAGDSVFYSTFIGGAAFEESYDVEVDAFNNAIVTGQSTSSATDYPVTTGPFGTLGLGDMLVTKVNAAGSGLVWSTLIGGAGLDIGRGIELDAAQQVYIAGSSQSAIGFPVTLTSYDPTHNGGDDIALIQLSADATTNLRATFIGGTGDEVAHAFDLGSDNTPYLAGDTTSTDFPTTLGAYDTTLGGTSDSFIARLSANFSNLEYGTYFGGSDTDTIFDIASELSGVVYVTGKTLSTDFPISALAYDTTHNGSDDVFISKLTNISSDPTAISLQSTQVNTRVSPIIVFASVAFLLMGIGGVISHRMNATAE